MGRESQGPRHAVDPIKIFHHQKILPYRVSRPSLHGGVLLTVGTGCVCVVGGDGGRWIPARSEGPMPDKGDNRANRLILLPALSDLLRYSDAAI
jgi:hypothetical protein